MPTTPTRSGRRSAAALALLTTGLLPGLVQLPALAEEGLARDVVRPVQQARRDAGLVVTDRIRLRLDGDPGVLDAVRAHEAHVAGQVLAVEIALGDVGGDALTVRIEGLALTLSLTVA